MGKVCKLAWWGSKLFLFSSLFWFIILGKEQLGQATAEETLEQNLPISLTISSPKEKFFFGFEKGGIPIIVQIKNISLQHSFTISNLLENYGVILEVLDSGDQPVPHISSGPVKVAMELKLKRLGPQETEKTTIDLLCPSPSYRFDFKEPDTYSVTACLSWPSSESQKQVCSNTISITLLYFPPDDLREICQLTLDMEEFQRLYQPAISEGKPLVILKNSFLKTMSLPSHLTTFGKPVLFSSGEIPSDLMKERDAWFEFRDIKINENSVEVEAFYYIKEEQISEELRFRGHGGRIIFTKGAGGWEIIEERLTNSLRE